MKVDLSAGMATVVDTADAEKVGAKVDLTTVETDLEEEETKIHWIQNKNPHDQVILDCGDFYFVPLSTEANLQLLRDYPSYNFNLFLNSLISKFRLRFIFGNLKIPSNPS